MTGKVTAMRGESNGSLPVSFAMIMLLATTMSSMGQFKSFILLLYVFCHWAGP